MTRWGESNENRNVYKSRVNAKNLLNFDFSTAKKESHESKWRCASGGAPTETCASLPNDLSIKAGAKASVEIATRKMFISFLNFLPPRRQVSITSRFKEAREMEEEQKVMIWAMTTKENASWFDILQKRDQNRVRESRGQKESTPLRRDTERCFACFFFSPNVTWYWQYYYYQPRISFCCSFKLAGIESFVSHFPPRLICSSLAQSDSTW